MNEGQPDTLAVYQLFPSTQEIFSSPLRDLPRVLPLSFSLARLLLLKITISLPHHWVNSNQHLQEAKQAWGASRVPLWKRASIRDHLSVFHKRGTCLAQWVEHVTRVLSLSPTLAVEPT